jgi:molybdopterin molybdotransferase
MHTVEEALRLVQEHARPLAPRRVPLGEAAGLLLAEDVATDVNSPPHDKALMDGYAVVSSDRQTERRVLEEVAAGDVPRRPLTPGSVTRVMTGAPLPDGADAVVALEQTELVDERTVRLLQTDPPPGQHILPLATSLRAGDVVLRRGAELRPIELGILAEIGQALVTAWPRPRVAVLPTGNELVPVGERPAPGQIRNSNGPMLLSAIGRLGATALELPIGRDDRGQLSALVEQGLEADVLVLCGGVSAGKFDLVPEVLGGLDVAQVFHKVALRPGKPLWFGVKSSAARQVLVFGLPGNPVSSLVCFELFVRPAIAALAGRGFSGATVISARLSHEFLHKGGRESCLPARISTGSAIIGDAAHEAVRDGASRDQPSVEILPWHGSADLATLARANALVRLPAKAAQIRAGTIVDVISL